MCDTRLTGLLTLEFGGYEKSWVGTGGLISTVCCTQSTVGWSTGSSVPSAPLDIGISELVFRYLESYSYLMGQPSDTSGHRHGSEPGRLLGLDDAQLLAERFKLLSDPSRLRMIYALVDAGEVCVSDLARLVEVSESATSHQLRQLRLAGLVRTRKRGREVFYRVADTHVRLLLDVAVEHYLHGHDEQR